MQNFARSQLEVSGVLRCDRSAAAIVSVFVSSKPSNERLDTDSETGRTPSRAEESGMRENLKQAAKSRSREMSRDRD